MDKIEKLSEKHTIYNPDESCKIMLNNIKKLCKRKKISPYVIARTSGISTSTMSYLLNGKTKPLIYTILMICNQLGVTIGELFAKEENCLGEVTEDSGLIR